MSFFRFLTDESIDTTEQAKNNISPFLFAIILPAKKEDDRNVGN